MRSFNMGSLSSWNRIATGELFDFGVPSSGYRKVEFDLISDAYISVSVVADDDAWLVGSGDGLMTVKFSTDRPVAVGVAGDPATNVFIRTLYATQVIPESIDPTFTTIEPRNSGPSEEIKRMMHIMKLNQVQRDLQLAAEREFFQQQMADLKAAAPAPVAPQQEVHDDGVVEDD